MKSKATICGLGALVMGILLFGAPRVAAESPRHGPGVLNIDSLLSALPLGKTQEIRNDEIAHDSLASIHLIQIRGDVGTHHHARHQETLWIVRGAGRLVLGKTKQKVMAGEVVSIPPGTPHSFHSLGVNPTVVISIFSPGFDGKDRIFDNPGPR